MLSSLNLKLETPVAYRSLQTAANTTVAIFMEHLLVCHIFTLFVTPDSVAWLVAHRPAELRIAGSIFGRGLQQCWRGKHWALWAVGILCRDFGAC